MLYRAARHLRLGLGVRLFAMSVEHPLPGRRAPMETLDRNRALLAQATGYVYKEVAGHELAAWVFKPENRPASTPLPAILFFFSSSSSLNSINFSKSIYSLFLSFTKFL